VIDLDVERWKQVEAGSGKLRKFIRPKDDMKSGKEY
jgi:hypothetical protein